MHLACNVVSEESCSRATVNVVFLPVVTAVRELTAGVLITYRYGKFTVAQPADCPPMK